MLAVASLPEDVDREVAPEGGAGTAPVAVETDAAGGAGAVANVGEGRGGVDGGACSGSHI